MKREQQDLVYLNKTRGLEVRKFNCINIFFYEPESAETVFYIYTVRNFTVKLQSVTGKKCSNH